MGVNLELQASTVFPVFPFCGHVLNKSRKVILTDEQGNHLGLADIEQAHRGEGMLHMAFSVYVFRSDGGQLLIQKRSAHKMLWPSIWANTCCSHPRQGENLVEAGMRRLQEECGFTCPLVELSSFVYRAEDPYGRGVEHEYDTLLFGSLAEAVEPNPDSQEIADWKWIDVVELRAELDSEPAKFAPWFRPGLERVLDHLAS